MGNVVVQSIGVSLDGFAAGTDQSLENPLGVRGPELMEWFFPTKTFREQHGGEGGETGIDDGFAAELSTMLRTQVTIMATGDIVGSTHTPGVRSARRSGWARTAAPKAAQSVGCSGAGAALASGRWEAAVTVMGSLSAMLAASASTSLHELSRSRHGSSRTSASSAREPTSSFR